MRWTIALLLLALAALAGCAGESDPDGLPWPEDSLVSLAVRTDFTDDAAWSEVRSALTSPSAFREQLEAELERRGGQRVSLGSEYEFEPLLELVDDRRYEGFTVDRLLDLVPEDTLHAAIFMVDRETLTQPDHPVLVVDLHGRRGRTFRVIPEQMWNVQANLAIANVSWEDFADSTDEDGVFRGLPY